jgi:proteic killer suppression protein
LRLHPLKGDQGGRWAVDVSGNWRITFSVNADGAFDELDYEDYH